MTMSIKLPDAAGGRRSLNKRTALVLLSIALAFFGGVIAKYWLLAPSDMKADQRCSSHRQPHDVAQAARRLGADVRLWVGADTAL